MQSSVSRLMVASLLLVLGLVGLTQWAAQANPAPVIIHVNSTGDDPDANTGNGVCATAGGVCTLRAALEQATAGPLNGVPVDIEFSIQATGNNCTAGVCTITPATALPAIDDSAVTRVLGFSQVTQQPGNCTQFAGLLGPGPCIVLDGGGNVADGLVISSSNNFVQGLAIINFCTNDSGIHINSGATFNTIRDNYIGIKADGTTIVANCTTGITVEGTNNTIGPNNVISGNDGVGVKIENAANSNTVANNIIGLDAGGTLGKGNGGDGVSVDPANDTIIQGNVISGNNNDGVDISGDRNKVLGNLIGTNAAGSAAVANGDHGVLFDGDDNELGGTTGGGTTFATLGDRNVVSGNGDGGAKINSGKRNEVLGNIIGLDITGTNPIPNAEEGLKVKDADNCVGGRNTGNTGTTCVPVAGFGPFGGAGNIISGNTREGLILKDGSNEFVFGNFIGTDITGLLDKGNGSEGIKIVGPGNLSQNNTIGGTDPKARNVISGNGRDGILVQENSDSNAILGNIIGLDKNGVNAIPNDDDGIDIDEADSNCIGGSIVAGVCTPSASSGNIISANKGNGINSNGNHNTIVGNTIGLAADGSTDRGNTLDGVRIYAGGKCTSNSNNNVIGGTTVNHRNVISGNGLNGVRLTSDGNCDVDDNSVLGNYIGTNAAGTASVPNDEDGVHIAGPSGKVVIYVVDDNCIGGLVVSGDCIPEPFTGTHLANGLAGNLISGNGTAGAPAVGGDVNGDNGIEITGDGVEHTAIISNFIGTNAAGTSAIPNRNNGIFDNSLVFDTTCIGSSFSLNECTPVSGTINGRNVISGNGTNGIKITCAAPPNCGTGFTVDQIIANYIGTDWTGTFAVPNGADGIFVDPDSFNTIGGNAAKNPLIRNVISGNLGNGVHISGVSGPPLTVTSTDNRIQGNFIGTAANGFDRLGNVLDGVRMDTGAQFNLVGVANSSSRLNSCTAPFVKAGSAKLRVTPADGISSGNLGFGNVIAFNRGHGVEVNGGQSFSNTIRCNSIHDNAGKGIALTADSLGVGNNNIPPPSVTATSSIDGTANVGSTVDGYNDNNGEGQTVIGQANPNTLCNCDGAGICQFHIDGSNPLPDATATQTDALGDTSEFSNSLTTLNCVVVALSSPTTLKFHKNGYKTITLTVQNQGTLAAEITGIAGLIAKNLSVKQIKFGKKTLLPPFDITLPPATQQTFKVKLQSTVKQTVSTPFVSVVGNCNGFDFNAPGSAGDELGLISTLVTPLKLEQLSLKTQAGQLVAEAKGLGIQSVQLQVYDTAGRLLANQMAQGAKLVLTPERQLANGVYLAVMTVRGQDSKTVRSEVKKVIVVR